MNDFERRLDEAFPAEPLSDALRERVARLRPERRPSPIRPLLMLGAGLGAAALGLVLLLPRSASAAALVAQAKEGFVGHSRTYRLDDKGSRRLASEGWYAPGRSRLDTFDPDGPRLLILDAHKGFALVWDSGAGSLKLSKLRSGIGTPWFPAALDSTTLAQSLRQVRGPLPPLEDGVLDGRKVKRADLRENGRGVVLYGEHTTLRLVAFELTTTLRHWGPMHELTYLEPGSPSDAAFEPFIEMNGRKVDGVREHDRIEKELAKGVASYPVPGGTLAVRRVAMNRHGDLFVLYTGLGSGDYRDYFPTAVTDDAGGTYVKGIGLLPFLADRGFAFGGKPLAGAWYTRLGGGRPNRVAVTFRRAFAPGGKAEIRHTQAIVPQPVDVLDFQPFLAMGLASEEAMEEGRAFAREGYYERNGQWALMERWARRDVTLSDARLKGPAFHGNAFVHFLLAKALTMQGKRTEARREIGIVRARLDPEDPGHLAQRLLELEHRLGGA